MQIKKRKMQRWRCRWKQSRDMRVRERERESERERERQRVRERTRERQRKREILRASATFRFISGSASQKQAAPIGFLSFQLLQLPCAGLLQFEIQTY